VDKEFAVLVYDFTQILSVYRRRYGGRTQAEMRSRGYGYLTIAAVFRSFSDEELAQKYLKSFEKDGCVDVIEYYDFVDEDARDNTAVFLWALKQVVRFLCKKGKTKFAGFGDTCGRQFFSRYCVRAVLLDVVNELNEEGCKIEEFSLNFFCPYHGKCICNGHFAKVKGQLKKYALTKECFGGFGRVVDVLESGRKVFHAKNLLVVPPDLPIRPDAHKISDMKKYLSFERVNASNPNDGMVKIKPLVDSDDSICKVQDLTFVVPSQSSQQDTTPEWAPVTAAEMCLLGDGGRWEQIGTFPLSDMMLTDCFS